MGITILLGIKLTSKGVTPLSKIMIESTDKNDTAVDIEEKLEKAVDSIKLQRENKQFRDVYLKTQKDKSDKIVNAVFNNLLS